MTVFCAVVACIQAVVALRYFLRTLLSRRAPPAAGVPVSVIIPCRGGNAELEENAAAMIGQDYAPGAEFIFVVASEKDPALGRLRTIAASRADAKVRVLVSGAVPRHCGEKSLNMVHGAEHASGDTRALVFADSDVRVPPGWLKELCGGLAGTRVGAVTAPALFRAGPGLSGDIACAWSAIGTQYLDMASCVVGHSFAITKDLYSRLGIAELWKKSLSDDLAITGRIAESGLKVAYAYGALPAVSASPGYAELFSLTSRWMLYFKFYYPTVWLLGAALSAFKIFVVCWAIFLRAWVPAAVLFGADLLQVYVSVCALRAGFGERFVPGRRPCVSRLPFTAWICVPALQFVYLFDFISSAVSARVRWGGYGYRLRGPQNVSAEPLI